MIYPHYDVPMKVSRDETRKVAAGWRGRLDVGLVQAFESLQGQYRKQGFLAALGFLQASIQPGAVGREVDTWIVQEQVRLAWWAVTHPDCDSDEVTS